MRNILKAGIEDLNDLVQVQIKAFSIDVKLCGEGPPGYDSIERQKKIMENHLYYKIVDDSGIIGGFYIKPKGSGHYELVRLFIEPSHQGKGIGSYALKYIEELFHNLEIIELEASDFRTDNHRFYESRGYIKVGETEYSHNSFSYNYRKTFRKE